MTAGRRYVDRLNDGRQVWLDGAIVPDIRSHPAFHGTVQSVAAVMDLQDDPATESDLTYITDTGVRANLAFFIPDKKEDLFRRSRAFQIWSDATYGVMSRVGGFYRSQLTAWHIASERIALEQPQFPEKIAAYYRYVRDHDLLLTAAGHDPQIDRTKLASELGDLYTAVRIVRETQEGIIVRGAKMIATGGPYMDEIMVSPHGKKTGDEQRYAAMFAIPASHPGVHLICRESFASDREEDHPLSSRFDEMDAVLVFDDALIPWERVFIKDDPDSIWKIRSERLVSAISLHENIVRLVSKLEFTAAVGNELANSIGITKFAHVQEKLAELFFQLESIKALLLSSEHRAVYNSSGVWEPELEPIITAKNLGNRYYPRALELLQQLSGAGMLQVPSTIAELRGPLGAQLKTYYRGADRDAEERVKLLKLSWDLVGSRLGARHELYERFYAGDPVRTYAGQYVEYDKQPLLDKAFRRSV
ncbi:4-hydroxyphenylacetate 3-hydroxylase family protein [Paenibacillus radicis (ex Gao et al. 2016)]|uniref:4-hydroxyphenylacetate 3-monooxygenase oxygenase component n=1 Tax=Paenibacillus radicis (ex Gao et al. 2016) TaxID=1737354 RepID=A0A917HBN2_9BACL|nr:4-hydroxyphenylacetate 3-hydroxylase N-terminal domain-containing protein [Paenibacillus radicis (ex Gao et al. 2016)]GGG74085.1 4-hydroxyphenylacetate 3-monooxygenase oxygenase component [Paenibacillus radicis (ex Gao et al. 2016)]